MSEFASAAMVVASVVAIAHDGATPNFLSATNWASPTTSPTRRLPPSAFARLLADPIASREIKPPSGNARNVGTQRNKSSEVFTGKTYSLRNGVVGSAPAYSLRNRAVCFAPAYSLRKTVTTLPKMVTSDESKRIGCIEEFAGTSTICAPSRRKVFTVASSPGIPATTVSPLRATFC